jgi:nicotinate-nucleotide adenylyltransferase
MSSTEAPDRSLRVIYGGTFDPVHLGHVAVAEAAAQALAPCILHLLPAADPPHRAAPGASAAQRLAMLRLAFAAHPEFLLDTRELERAGPSYMVDTLRHLRGEFGTEEPLVLLLGEDAFRGLPGWHCWRELIELCHLAVVPRGEEAFEALPAALVEAGEGHWCDSPATLRNAPAGRWLRLPFRRRPESATAARSALASGKAMAAGLDPAVARYIAAQGLYG